MGVAAGGIRRYTGLHRNLVAMLRDTVERHPDRTAVVELDGPEATYAELWERARRIAGGLRARGVQPGDRVAVRLPNGLAWVLAFWGSHLAGAVVVPLNTRLAKAEVEFVLADSGAVQVISDELPDGDPVALPDPEHQALAALFYTS